MLYNVLMETQTSMRRTPPPRGPVVAVGVLDPEDEPRPASWLKREIARLIELLNRETPAPAAKRPRTISGTRQTM